MCHTCPFFNLYMFWRFVSLQVFHLFPCAASLQTVNKLSLLLLFTPLSDPRSSTLFSQVTIPSPDLLWTTSRPFYSRDRLPEPCVVLQIPLEPRVVASLYCSDRKPLFCVSVCDMFLDNSSNNAICFLGGGEAKRGTARLIWWVRSYPSNPLACWEGILYFLLNSNLKHQCGEEGKIKADLGWVTYNPPSKIKKSKPCAFPRSLN